jgi:hypothetical protein
MTLSTQSSAVSAEPQPRFRLAFEKLAPELTALPVTDYVQINVDIPTAVATALGAMNEIRALRPAVSTLPNFDLERFDKLEDYALALGHAHGAYLAASAPPRSLEELAEEAAGTREVLLSDGRALATRGLIDPGRLGEVGRRTGYRNTAFDLLTLVNVLREHWSRISGKTAVTAAELEKAEVLADRLLTAAGEREQAPVAVGASANDRQAAFTLFVSAYDQARRAMAYLRWTEGDADNFVPSLYGNRKRRRDPEAPPSEIPTSPEPVQEVPRPPAAAVPVGLPGGSPFQE